jgi:DNA polymerase-3 subunit alpha
MHDHYSIKRAFGKPSDYLLKAEEMGLKYLSITNYGNDHAWPYYRSELDYLNNHGHNIDIQFLYGVELFITQDMTSKGRPNFDDINRGNDTIILMAKNSQGYVDLLKILSDANLPEHYFLYPRIDFDYLTELNAENLVCLMPYDFGTIARLLIGNEEEHANELIGLFQEVFGEDLYFEVSANVSPVNKIINKKVLEFAGKHHIECFASCNVHYPSKEDKKVHDVVLAFGDKKTFAENNLYTLGADDHYLRDRTSVEQGLHENDINNSLIEELISNTEKIAAKCSFDLEIAPMSLPDVDVILPDEYKGKKVEYFEYLIEKGWQELIIPRIDSGEWDEIKSADIPVYEERKNYEFNMIKNIFTMRDPNHPMQIGFIPYFLMVSDYTKWAKGIDRRIMQDFPIIEVGPARGSVSGSLIGYLTRMSTIDPIPWGLTFERFINPERVSWPDVDLDFDPDWAWGVERYLIETYGYDNVAHIITFQTAAGKKAFEAVSKVLSGKYGKYRNEVKADKLKSDYELKKLIPMTPKEAREIQDIMDSARSISGQLNPESVEFNEQLYEYYKLSAYKEMFDIMAKMEGLITSTGSHPGAVVITEKPLYYYTSRVNTEKYPDGYPLITTSYEKYALEEVNTMKFDILRLRELTIVKACLNFIKESIGIDVNLDKINPFDMESNIKILQLMKDGDLDGVFQFSSHLYKSIIEEVLSGIESRGDEEIAKDLFNIIVALEALGRPGPLEGGMVPTFASGLANPDSVERVHPDVDEILSETFGNMLYQEQVMFILRKLGGFSLGQADMVRRGIASGKVEKIEEQRIPFLDGVKKVQLEKNPNTTPEEMEALLKLAEHIFELMKKWSEYGFNKAHSVGYGFLTLRGAYLKANYKPHFMAALMSANSGNEEKITRYIDEIRARGINVLPPKINKSLLGFTVVGEEILFGLKAIKGVGDKAIEKIIAGYPYINVMDFISKVGTRTILPPLIKAGYFEEDKKFLLKYYEVLMEIKACKTKAEESLVDYLLENGITESNQNDISKRLENIIYEKSLKKRTEKTRNECLNLIHREEYSNIDFLNMEKEVLGLFLSESPLDNFSDIIISQTTLCNNIKEHKVNEEFYIVGMILETPQARKDKNKNDMCFLKVQMYDGILECPVFAGAYEKYKTRLTEGKIIIAKAKKIRGGVTLNQIADLVEKEQEFREYFGVGIAK